MALDIVTPPAAEPLTVEEAKAWLRLDGGAEDQLVTALIAAARGAVENACGRLLLARGWRWRLDAWPPGNAVRLPVSPVTAVTAVTVVTPEGATDVPATNWMLATASDPARLVFLRPPQLPAAPADGVTIAGRAGLAETPAGLPEPLRHAVRMTLAALWENRGDAAVPAAVPPAALALLEPWRRIRL
jgi:uncharacterized phiE125 gp8 family phage protein